MYSFLRGKLVEKDPSKVVIDVQGVGYQLLVPLSTFSECPDVGQPIELKTYLHVREDILGLYGFYCTDEKKMFLALLSISGVGPKVALNIVSHLPFSDLKHIIAEEDTLLLQRVPGVGKKMASRIILELKEKIKDDMDPKNIGESSEKMRSFEDALLALISLGYKRSIAEGALKKVIQKNEKLDVEQSIRLGLQVLSG